MAASLLNVILDLVFVIGLHMGVAGVATATVLSQFLSAGVCLLYVLRRMPMLRFGLGDLKCEAPIVRELLRIGFPVALSSCGVSLSVMFMQRAVNAYGSTVMAAYTIGERAEQLGMCLAFSIGMAVGTFCGQNAGARKFDRVKQGFRVGHFLSLGYALGVSLLVSLFTRPLARLFTSDPEVLDIAVNYMRIIAIFLPALGLVFIYQNFLRSMGDVAPTIWMSITEILARSVLAFVFSAMFGYVGIWWVTPLGWIASLLIGILRYRSGAWAKRVAP